MTERISRRGILCAAALGWGLPAWAADSPAATRVAAAWDDNTGHHIGTLSLSGSSVRPLAGIEVPTRAHGLLVERGGAVVAVARRPGDWMLRWQPGQATASWTWAEPGRAFCGHAANSADGRWVFTTETDLDSGAGLVGVRDARTLAKQAEWPTHGIDPHEMLLTGDALLVANGGVPTQPETGRAKRELGQMDSSLVKIGLADGRRIGQWRLPDPRLSLRHLARNGRWVGIALQAEHDDPAARASAPLLAVFDGNRLDLIDGNTVPTAGYAGDIAALNHGFAVSATRANQVLRWEPGTGWARPLALSEAGALADFPTGLWAAGRDRAIRLERSLRELPNPVPGLRIDNHWVPLDRRAGTV